MIIDPISIISLVLSILIVGCFFLLLIMQINKFSNQKVENPFFIVAIIAGSIAIISYIFDTILWISKPDVTTRINLQSYTFFFFTISFYAWYKHYQKILLVLPSSENLNYNNILKKFRLRTNLMNSISTFDILIFIGLAVDVLYYVFYILGINLMFGFFWDLLHLNNTDGRMVTIFSHIAFLSGFIFFYVAYIIISNNLIELNKVLIYELFAIIILGFSNLFLFFNDIFVTFSLYSYDIGNLIVSIGLLTFFISLIMLLSNFIILNPSHIQNPSILKDIAHLINKIEDPVFTKQILNSDDGLHSIESNQQKIINNLQIPQKLNGTCIIILIYLMKNNNHTTLLAKDLEIDLNLNKSTISYNLKILERNDFIIRNSPISKNLLQYQDDNLDQRQKYISISDNGKKFLIMLNQYLSSIF